MEPGEGIAIPAWWFKGWGRRQHNGGCAPPARRTPSLRPHCREGGYLPAL